MTLERKEAFQLLEKMPEDKIKLIIQHMQKIDIASEKNNSHVNDSLNALKELQELSGRLPEDFDYEKELQEALGRLSEN